MDAQKIKTYFSKPDKLLLGVASTLSYKANIPTFLIRIGILIITLVFIPIGILMYLFLYFTLVLKKGKTISFSLSGLILGIPLSYFFQPEMIKNWRGGTGVFGYFLNIPTILEEYDQLVGNGWSIFGNILLSMVIFGCLGAFMGYYLDKNKSKKPS